MNWKETTLGEIAYINPSTNLAKGTLAKCIAMENLAPFTRKVAGYELKEFKGGMKFINGDTLLARITPCLENGKTSRMDILEKDEVGFGSTEYIVIREKEGLSDSQFLYYFSISPRFREAAIKSMTGTSGRQRVQTELIANKKFEFPSLPEQKQIAAMLSSFDDKIELLWKENETLEKIAQGIFKEWFVNFTIDRKKLKLKNGIPEGWRVGKMKDVVKICGGSTPDTKNPSYWNGNINWTSPKDLSNSREMFLTKTENKITERGLEKISSGLFPIKTLLLSSRAPIGYLAITNIPVAINQGYIAFLPEGYLTNEYMYLWLRLNMGTVISSANGSTFLEISKTSFKNIEIIIPGKEILDSFQNIINPIFDKVLNNINQIQTLSRLRDTLLPKLMSGEILLNKN